MPREKITKACLDILEQIKAGQLDEAEKAFEAIQVMDDKRFLVMSSVAEDSKTNPIDFPASYQVFLENEPFQPMDVLSMLMVIKNALHAAKNQQAFIESIKQVTLACERAFSETDSIKARDYLTQARRRVLRNHAIAKEQVVFQQKAMSVVDMLSVVEEKLGPINGDQLVVKEKAIPKKSLKDFESSGEFVPKLFADELMRALEEQHQSNNFFIADIKFRAEETVKLCQQVLEQIKDMNLLAAADLLHAAKRMSIDIPFISVEFLGKKQTLAQVLQSSENELKIASKKKVEIQQQAVDATNLCRLILQKIEDGNFITAEAFLPEAKKSCVLDEVQQENVWFFQDIGCYQKQRDSLMTVNEMFAVVEMELETAKQNFIEILRKKCIAAFQIITRNGDLTEADEILKEAQMFARHKTISDEMIQFFIRVNEAELKQGSMTFAGMLTTLAIELSRERRRRGKQNQPIAQEVIEVKPIKPKEESSSFVGFFSSLFSRQDDEKTLKSEGQSQKVSVESVSSLAIIPVDDESVGLASNNIAMPQTSSSSEQVSIAAESQKLEKSSSEVSSETSHDVVDSVSTASTDSKIQEALNKSLQQQLAKEVLQRVAPSLSIDDLFRMVADLNLAFDELLEKIQAGQGCHINFSLLAKEVQKICTLFNRFAMNEEISLFELPTESLSVAVQNYRDIVAFALMTIGNAELGLNKQSKFKGYVNDFIKTCKVIDDLESEAIAKTAFLIREADHWPDYLLDGLKKAGITLQYEKSEKFEIEAIQAFENKLDEFQRWLNKITNHGPSAVIAETYNNADEALEAYLNKLNAETKELNAKIIELMEKELISPDSNDAMMKKYLEVMQDYKDGVFWFLSLIGQQLQKEFLELSSTLYEPKRKMFVGAVNYFVENLKALDRIEGRVQPPLPNIMFSLPEDLHPYLKNKIEITGMVPKDSPYHWPSFRM